MMRIITGKAKGIHLKTLEGNITRPTAERVKEAVFSMLQFDIEGRTVLDLFAGSGQMSLEALSRGASNAVLVDASDQAINIIKENTKKCNLTSQCAIIKSDYLNYIRRNSGSKFDIVFIDPPYALNYYLPAISELYNSNMLKPSSILICESDTEDIFKGDDLLRGKFTILKHAKYGRSFITIITPKAE